VETVSSIHATGMRVAYNNGDADGLSLPPPSIPAGYQAGPQLKAIRALSLSGKGAKGIEGGKAFIGKVKNIGKKRKSVNPFVKSDPEPLAEGGEEPEVDVAENPGEAYVAALEAEADDANASHAIGDDIVGAYPYTYEQQYYGQYAGYDGQYHGYGQGEDGEAGYEYYGEAAEGGEAYAEGQQGGQQQGGAYGY